MKNNYIKSILTIVFILMNILSFGQVKKTTRKIVTLLPEQSVFLNSTSNGYFYGGKSRIDYKIDLPENTIEWYYTFSTTPTEGKKLNLGLAAQLTRLMDPSGLTSLAISSINIPMGSGVIDVFVMDKKNRDAFLQKDALGTWVYESPGGYDEGKTLNAKQGSRPINDIRRGTVYIGLKNPSANSGIGVTLEVAALVEETNIDNTTWSDDKKKTIYNNLYDYLKGNNIDINTSKEIAGCMADKFCSQYNPEQIDNMAEGSKQTLIIETYKSCASKYETEKTPEQQKGITFGNLGWKNYENGDIDKAIEYSKRALNYDKTLGFVKANLGLFTLIKGDETSAMDYYVDAISDIERDKINAKKTFLSVLDDINQAVKKYPDFKGYQSITDLLKEEMKNYQ